MASTTETKTVSGDRGIDKSAAKGLLLQFGLYLDKEGYGQDSRYVSFIRMLLNSNCNIHDPENVKEIIAKKKWKNGTKMLCCYSYDALARLLGLKWEMPSLPTRRTPILPTRRKRTRCINHRNKKPENESISSGSKGDLG